MNAADLIAEARTLLGTPFLHQGRQPGVGIDCGGLIVHLLAFAGIDYDITGYSRVPAGDRLKRHCDAVLESKSKYELEPADVLLFSIKRDPQHIGLYTGRTIVHAWYSAGPSAGVVEHRLTDLWTKRLVAAYRIPGIG